MRQIYIVNATQVVTSESHPEGLYSVVSGYPKTFDSLYYGATVDNLNGNEENALNAAKAEYFSRLAAVYVGSPSRVMATVTLERADGRTIMMECIGAFPDLTPQPEPVEVEQGDS